MPDNTHPHVTESKFRLLYLGADLEFIKALRPVLPKPDYRLVTCSEFGSARLFIETDIPYDLMLVDLEWRDGEGLTLATLAKSLSRRKRMPIILVSATELNSELKAKARKAGVNKFVVKSEDPAAISEAARRMIDA